MLKIKYRPAWLGLGGARSLVSGSVIYVNYNYNEIIANNYN